jgi:transcription antitermination protein NusB
MARRTKAREVVVQMLYLRDLNPDVAAEDVRALLDDQIRGRELREFAWRLFVGVMEWRPQLDDRIQAAAENWALARMAPTDRNVLRLGAYELLNTDTPHRVVLDEAIELAKRFGAEQSPQFVNGVLDRLVPAERRRNTVDPPRDETPDEEVDLRTERLALVAATEETLTAALAGPGELGSALGVTVPATWPPEFLDEAALEFTRGKLAAGDAEEGWWMYFVLLREDAVLVGSAGFKGPPRDGTVEIGYGIVTDYRRRGYAAETVRGLLQRAFDRPDVERVIAETLPDLVASIAVLRTCGFERCDGASEPGAIRFELIRAGYESARS